MDFHLNRLKLRLASRSRLWPSFSLALFRQGRLVCTRVCVLYVCARVCASVCVCIGGVARVLKGGGGGGPGERCLSIGRQWPSLLYFKRLPFAPELQKSRELRTHSHHIFAFCFNERGEKIQSRDIPESCFVEVQYEFIVLIEWVRQQTIYQYD